MNNFKNMYFKIPIVIRYTVVTLINSLIAYLFYIGLFLNMYFKNYFYFAIVINFIVPATLSYCTMRFFVFNTKTPPLQEYLKTIIVYAIAFFIDLLFYAFLFTLLGVNILAVNIISTLITFIYTYIALKSYAFNIHVDYFFRQKKYIKKVYSNKSTNYLGR